MPVLGGYELLHRTTCNDSRPIVGLLNSLGSEQSDRIPHILLARTHGGLLFAAELCEYGFYDVQMPAVSRYRHVVLGNGLFHNMLQRRPYERATTGMVALRVYDGAHIPSGDSAVLHDHASQEPLSPLPAHGCEGP